MMKKALFFLAVILSLNLHAQKWKMHFEQPKGELFFTEPMPQQFSYFYVDDRNLRDQLSGIPYRFETTRSGRYVNFPVDLAGHQESFEILSTRYMEEDLARNNPDIHTFAGKSKSGKSVYVALTKYRIYVTVLRPGQTTFLLKPYSPNTWIGFSIDKQIIPGFNFQCDTEEITPGGEPDNQARPGFNDGTLRTFRYAVSTTGEFSQYTLNRLGISASASISEKKNAILGELVAAVTRINSVYERDLSVRMQLVNNNDQIIFLDPNNDPFDNNTTNMSSLIGANQNTVDSNIGSANYDASQVWCQGVLQGLARLGQVCQGFKASSAARGRYPETDRFIISVASHELGHLFGANHVFSNSTCGGRRNDDTAVETGSGTTIMAYAGICPPDIQDWTDDRFNTASLNEIENFIRLNATCSTNTSTGNQAPVLTLGPSRYVPKQTPLMIPVSATDPDGDTITFVWDEYDRPQQSQNISTPPQPTWTHGPMFRPFPPTTDTVRFLPNLDSLLTNRLSTTWEVLPSVTRLLRFKVTARDNNPAGGQTATNEIVFGVEETAGPFELTSQTGFESWQHGETKNITWNVAGTDGGNVNCQTVDIIFSTDGGRHFTDTLAANIPNNGTATITVPSNINTPSGRLMVKAQNNYFFTLSRGSISVGNFQNSCGHQFSRSPALIIPDNNTNGIYDTIHIADNEYISDVNLNLNISHQYVRDLFVELISPAGTHVVLWNHNCGGEDNLQLTFDDQGNNISCSNLSGNITPVEALSAFNSQYSQGDWIIHIVDNNSPDEGILNSWGLDFCFIQQNIATTKIPGLKIYPNPSNGVFNIEIPELTDKKVSVQITDMSGRPVYQKDFETYGNHWQAEIHVPYLQKGNYILKVATGKQLVNEIIQIK